MKDGGPAFPHVHGLPVPEADAPFIEKREVVYHGLTLRDYFAAAALQGLLAYGAQTLDENIPEETALTKDAYLFADAMLAEREKP